MGEGELEIMLFTPAYIRQNKLLHEKKPNWGNSGGKWLGLAREIALSNGVTKILDYGCGKGALSTKLKKAGFMVTEYDPAISGKDLPPEPKEMVVCTDVLEHIEPQCLDAVLEHLKRLTVMVIFITISLQLAKKSWLPNGENAHQIVRSKEWWLRKLESKWDVVTILYGRGLERELVVKAYDRT